MSKIRHIKTDTGMVYELHDISFWRNQSVPTGQFGAWRSGFIHLQSGAASYIRAPSKGAIVKAIERHVESVRKKAAEAKASAEKPAPKTPGEELVTLRVSVARIAQALGVDNRLKVTGLAYEELRALAMHEERGWNDLAGRCAEAKA